MLRGGVEELGMCLVVSKFYLFIFLKCTCFSVVLVLDYRSSESGNKNNNNNKNRFLCQMLTLFIKAYNCSNLSLSSVTSGVVSQETVITWH